MTPKIQNRTAGGVAYTLTRKNIKRINLRLGTGGSVQVSAPLRAPLEQIDRFVAGNAGWVEKAREKQARRTLQAEQTPLPGKEEAFALFQSISDEIFPLFSAVLGGEKPVLKVRQMKTRWGVCAPARKQITLNLLLAARPRPQVEYVILHEYCHFVHLNHQAEFWALMISLMPDCKERRKALRG